MRADPTVLCGSLDPQYTRYTLGLRIVPVTQLARGHPKSALRKLAETAKKRDTEMPSVVHRGVG
jgi:hypothetical protein